MENSRVYQVVDVSNDPAERDLVIALTSRERLNRRPAMRRWAVRSAAATEKLHMESGIRPLVVLGIGWLLLGAAVFWLLSLLQL
jgi:hypothetical protein